MKPNLSHPKMCVNLLSLRWWVCTEGIRLLKVHQFPTRNCHTSAKQNLHSVKVVSHQSTWPCRFCVPLQVTSEHSLQLQPMERVVTVAWQNTQQGQPLEPYQAAAAILTTQVCMLSLGEHVYAWTAYYLACRPACLPVGLYTLHNW